MRDGNKGAVMHSPELHPFGKDILSLPAMPTHDGVTTVYGDSMHPLLKAGDMVAYKLKSVDPGAIWYGEMYLTRIKWGCEDCITVVGYLQKSDKEGHIKLEFHNPDFATMEVPFDSIQSIGLIKASIRINN